MIEVSNKTETTEVVQSNVCYNYRLLFSDSTASAKLNNPLQAWLESFIKQFTL